MGTLDDKLLGEKIHNYCSSSEDEGGNDDSDCEEENASKPKMSKPTVIRNESPPPNASQWSGSSTNTGPKGVIKDWQRFKQLENEKRADQERERLALMKRLCITSKTSAEDEEAKKQDDFDAELDELLNDDFLLEYQKKKMAEMLALSGRMPKFGSVYALNNGIEFLNAIDSENKNVTIVIHIYEDKISACRIMNQCLNELAKEYTNVKFCKIIGSEAGMSKHFKSSGCPALLIYKGGQIIGNFVRLTDEFGDAFCHSDVEGFLIEHGMLSDKSCVPIITECKSNYDDDDD